MAALAIVRRDLFRYLRNPVRTAMLFAVPIMLSGIFAVVFGGGGAEQISIKILLFVLVDGWYLLIKSLVQSFKL